MVDNKDKELLRILEKDGRIDNSTLAGILELSEEDLKARIKRLEEEEIILQYKTIINWDKVGEEKVYAFIDVKVTPERDVGFDTVARRIYQFPEVHSLYLLSGTYDLAVVVEGKSMKEIAGFVAEKLAPLPGVQSTVTHFMLKKYKIDGRIVEEKKKDKRLPLTP
jgi:DNA-binding Lrp family transcriptional regulator